jgi:hypothetical protein
MAHEAGRSSRLGGPCGEPAELGGAVGPGFGRGGGERDPRLIRTLRGRDEMHDSVPRPRPHSPGTEKPGGRCARGLEWNAFPRTPTPWPFAGVSRNLAGQAGLSASLHDLRGSYPHPQLAVTGLLVN